MSNRISLHARLSLPVLLASTLVVSLAHHANAADLSCEFTEIATANYNLCGITEGGTIQCTGSSSIADDVPAGTFSAISARGSQACAIRDDGTVACWGTRCYPNGQPFPGGFTCEDASTGTPAGVFVQVSAGGSNACGLRNDGSLECWGSEDFWDSFVIPTGPYVEVASGAFHGCARSAAGSIECFGFNLYQATDPPPADNVPPIDVFTSIDSSLHNCGLRGGEAVCWWRNDNHQSDPPSGTFSQLAVGAFHTCGLRPDGTVECWGDDVNGETVPPPLTFTQVVAGARSCGLRADGTVRCWGYGTDAGAAAVECPVCGNGLLATTEECDDGNMTDGDGCTSSCTTLCGDGYVVGDEECDDGDTTDGNGCDINCTPTGCGNGHKSPGEYCDDGNTVDGDGCDSNCTGTVCHNGILTSAEECDDGNFDDFDGCSECRISCPNVPQSGCGTASHGTLLVSDNDHAKSLTWKWKKGAATQWFDFTDFADARFDLCFYPDSTTLEDQLIVRGIENWSYVGGDPDEASESTRGQRYRDKTWGPSGLAALDIRYGEEGRSSIQVKLKMNEGLLPATGNYTVQLIDQATGLCWTSAFTGGSLSGGRFRAKIEP